jgi:hypothetical protein
MNLYAYVGNDPVNFTDPWGLRRWVCKAGEGDDYGVTCSPDFSEDLLDQHDQPNGGGSRDESNAGGAGSAGAEGAEGTPEAPRQPTESECNTLRDNLDLADRALAGVERQIRQLRAAKAAVWLRQTYFRNEASQVMFAAPLIITVSSKFTVTEQ